MKKMQTVAIGTVCIFFFHPGMEASASESSQPIQTLVAPLAGEDIAQPCAYSLVIPEEYIDAVFVIFERGKDSHRFFEDPDVRSFAHHHRLAMMMPLHCASKDQTDMDVDPAKGLGRALFQALKQFAESTGHHELAAVPLIYLGFSGAGALAARMPGYAPERSIAAVLSHAGQSPPLGLNTIVLSKEGLSIPQLVLVGGNDTTVGTQSGYEYFSRYWQTGAPWLFATQNNGRHCCTIDAKELILSWLESILQRRLGKNAELVPLKRTGGLYAFFRIEKTNVLAGKSPTYNAVDLSVELTEQMEKPDQVSAGWLPSKQTAREWMIYADRPSRIVVPQ